MQENLIKLISEAKPLESFENFLQIILTSENKNKDSFTFIFNEVG